MKFNIKHLFRNIFKSIKNKNSTNFMILFVSSSSMVNNLLGIVSGILIAKWILPEILGEFNSYTIFSSYILLAQIGIPIALGRELPLHFGRGNFKFAEENAQSAQFFLLSLGLGSLIVTFSISIISIFHSDYISAAGFAVIGLLAFEGFFVTQYLKILYRGNLEFNKLATMNLFAGIAAFVGILFVYFWGFYGLCLRALLRFTVLFYLAWKWRPIRVKPKFDKLIFMRLLRIGFPMFLVTNVYALWPLAQKTMILTIGSKEMLGLYAIPIMVQGAMKTFSGAIGSVTYATMSREWGKGKNVIEIIKIAVKPILVASFLYLLIVPVGWIILPIFINKFIPDYSGSIEAAKWMLITGFIGLYNVIGNIYNVTNMQMQKLYSFILGAIFWIVSLFMLYKISGFSLEIFPKAMAIGYFFISLYNVGFIYNYKSSKYKFEK